MQSRLVWENAGERTFVLVLDAGEEAFAAISDFAAKGKLEGASLTALGAFERATVGWFDLSKKTYKPIEIGSQCEGAEPAGRHRRRRRRQAQPPHARGAGSERWHHPRRTFPRGIVRPTLEVTIVETPARLRRRKRPELGIALIDLSSSD